MNKKQQSDFLNRRTMPKPINLENKRPAWARLLLGAVCLSALIVPLVLFFQRAKPLTPSDTATRPSNTTPAASVVSNPGEVPAMSLALRKGDRLVYQLHQDRSLQLQGSSFGGILTKGATNESVTLHIAQDGDFVVNVYDETKKGWTVGFSVENAALKMTSGRAVAPADGSAAGLRSEILAFVEKSGRIGKMTAQTNTSLETLNHWRDILSRWQTVLPSRPADRSWKQTEQDATGTYVALYSRDSDQAPAVVEKKKQQYLSLCSANPNGLETRSKVNGTAVIKLDPYPTSIEGHEQLTILASEIGGCVASEADYSFHLRNATKAPEIEAFGTEKARQLELGGIPFSWLSTNAPLRTGVAVDIAGTTIEEQLGRLEQLLAAGMNGTPAEVKTLEKIVALIKKDDTTVDAVVERLSRPEVSKNTDLTSALIGMLGAGGTPKAQETLIGIVNTPDWPLEQREMAIFSFAQVTEPIPDVDLWLQQLHQENGDLANSSLLVLAAMGDRVREQNPDRFANISEYVIGTAGVPGLDLNEKVVALDAIANLGPQEVPEVVRSALAGDDPLLREKAVLRLKRMQGDTAESLVSNALQTDSAESVRMAAAGLLGDARWPGGCEDLSRAAVNDSSEHVRVAAVRSLGEWLDTNPQAGRVLQQVARQDASQDVRDAATQLLQNRGGFEACDDSANSSDSTSD